MLLLRRLNVFISKFPGKAEILSLSTLSAGAVLKRQVGKMQDGYVVINSVPTHIYTWGNWIEDKFDEKTKELVLVITGNPGLPGFYTKFCSTLYDELDKRLPIFVIGHAGHDEPKKESNLTTPSLKGNEHLYDLSGQLNHKIEFYNKFIPKDVKIYLIGHSIGSKFCMELMKIPEFSQQVEHCYLMFPAIERMVESNKGRKVHSFDRFFFLLRIFYNAFHWLPTSWKRAVVQWQCRKDEIPDEFLESSVAYTNPPVIDRIWFLALDEMEKIREIDEESIKINIQRLKFYYGAKDDWVRTEYYYELVEKFPGVDAELCKKGYEHAFVLKKGPEVGKMMAEWIRMKQAVVKQ